MSTEYLLEKSASKTGTNNCIFNMKHLILVICNHTHNIIIYIIFDLNNSTIVYPLLILQMPAALLGLFTAFLVAVPKGVEKKITCQDD
jgi:hypothetical protein